MKKLIIILSIMVVCISCNETNYTFKISYSSDSYDSQTGVFTRKMIGKDSVRKINLTQDQLTRINNLFTQYKFDTVKGIFPCPPFAHRPNTVLTYVIGYNSKQLKKGITYQINCDPPSTPAKKFTDLYNSIYGIIDETHIIDNLPPSNVLQP